MTNFIAVSFMQQESKKKKKAPDHI